VYTQPLINREHENIEWILDGLHYIAYW